MSDCNRGKRSEVITLTAFCALFLLGAVAVAIAVAYVSGKNTGRDQVTAREHYERAKHDALNACPRREGLGSVECITKAIEAAQDQSDSRQDLYAQQDMVKLTFNLLVVSALTLATSVAGLWALMKTITQGKVALSRAYDANKISRMEFEQGHRPILHVEPIGPVLLEPEWMPLGADETRPITFRVALRVSNYSQNMATILTYAVQGIDVGPNIYPTVDGGEIKEARFERQVLSSGPHNPNFALVGDQALILGREVFAKSKPTDTNDPIEYKRHPFARGVMTEANRHFAKPPPFSGYIIYRDPLGIRRRKRFAYEPANDWADGFVEWGGSEWNYDRKMDEDAYPEAANHDMSPE